MDKNDGTAAEFAKLLAVVAELRTRCPWDRDQKLADTPRHLIEEAYEVADAVARGDASEIADELGDLIAQCMFVATILGDDLKQNLNAQGALPMLCQQASPRDRLLRPGYDKAVMPEPFFLPLR